MSVSIPDQVHRLVFMHDSIVCPFFMEELTDIRDKDKTQVKNNYNSIYIGYKCQNRFGLSTVFPSPLSIHNNSSIM